MTPPIIWQPHAPTLVVAAAIVLAVALVALRVRTLGRRFPARVAAGLAVPAAVVAALIITALIDPSLPAHADEDRRIIVLVDQSTSMDVRDAGSTRRERAEILAEALRVPGGVRVERRWFDSAVHERPTAGGTERGTDLAACLQQLAPVVAAGDCAGIVVISDGGDEPMAADGLPAAPIAAIAVGADADALDNVALLAVDAPDGAEKDLEIEVSADLRATGSAAFRAELGVLPATLSVADGDGWREVARAPVDLAHGRARATFRHKPDAAGDVRLRIAVPAMPGEVTTLDNARTISLDVRERSLRVLYFSRTLGLDFKPLRAELARDPGISLTALYRTVGARLGGGGERFTVQGDRLAGDEMLDEGFPAEAAQLARYDVVILGSFAAASWPAAQQQALADHVANGAALVVVGGEQSFGLGGYATSPLGPLMPWQSPTASRRRRAASSPSPCRRPRSAIRRWPASPSASRRRAR